MGAVLSIMIEGQEGLTWERWRHLCELVEKLGRNDLCPRGSGRRFPPLLPGNRPFRRRTGRLLRP